MSKDVLGLLLCLVFLSGVVAGIYSIRRIESISEKLVKCEEAR